VAYDSRMRPQPSASTRHHRLPPAASNATARATTRTPTSIPRNDSSRTEGPATPRDDSECSRERVRGRRDRRGHRVLKLCSRREDGELPTAGARLGRARAARGRRGPSPHETGIPSGAETTPCSPTSRPGYLGFLPSARLCDAHRAAMWLRPHAEPSSCFPLRHDHCRQTGDCLGFVIVASRSASRPTPMPVVGLAGFGHRAPGLIAAFGGDTSGAARRSPTAGPAR